MIRIQSDGTLPGTVITDVDTGVEIKNVMSVNISMDAEYTTPVAVIAVAGVELDIKAQELMPREFAEKVGP